MTVVYLPGVDGGHRSVRLREQPEWAAPSFASRVALATPHVVADWRSGDTGGQSVAIDWEATLRFRRHLFGCGFGVVEATGAVRRHLDGPSIQELVRRSADEARQAGARIVAGVGTDHREGLTSPTDVVGAFAAEAEFVESTGGQVLMLGSHQLAAIAGGRDDYLAVYGAVLEQTSAPVIVQWPDEQADPMFDGYWGSSDVEQATETFLELVTEQAPRIDGVCVPSLDPGRELVLRSRLPDGVRMYTGNEFDYPEIIKGDGTHHSDALLTTLAAAAPAAAAALAALDRGDIDTYDREIAGVAMLSRHLAEPPSWCAESGVAFLAWLCGHQDGFTVIGGSTSARSTTHLLRAFELANEARLIPDPALAADRLLSWLDVAGVQL